MPDLVNSYNDQGTCTEIFGSQVFTGYRNVSNSNISPYDFQRDIFPNKTNIIGLDLNEMYAVTCGYQFSLDIVTLALKLPAVMIPRAIFARIR